MNNSMSFEVKYSILGSRITDFDGIYYTAVKTTGIFCKPSCRARTPKMENVVFYDSALMALENGFRPCKVCNPMQKTGSIPENFNKLINEIKKNPEYRITDKKLKERGLEAHTIRRWFKKNYGMTFQTFQRLVRMNEAFSQLKGGKSIAESAHKSGYASLSGFNETYKSIFGATVSESKAINTINVLLFNTIIGNMIACASETGLCFLGFTGQKNIEKQFSNIQKSFNAKILPGRNQHLKQVQVEINEYFEGQRTSFDVALDLIGTDFQKKAWRELLKIPFGKTISYKDQSILMGNPKAIRAMASANGANKMSIIIPCHRVIGSNGSLTGYAGGLHKKTWLLDFESETQQMKLNL